MRACPCSTTRPMPALNALAASGRAVPGLVAPLGGRLPIHDDALQAVASEPVKPMLDPVLLYLGTGTCVSGSDKGDRIFGGGVPAHGQRGNLPMQETIVSGLLETVPAFGQLKPLRQWAGVVDLVPDSSPILGPAGPEGLFLNCGRGTRATGGRMGISAVARCSRPRPRAWTSASVSVCNVTVIRCRPARIWCYRKGGHSMSGVRHPRRRRSGCDCPDWPSPSTDPAARSGAHPARK